MRFRRSNDSLLRLLLGCILLACPAQAQWVERGAKIAGAGASPSDTARQGSALALSADGTTAIEGGPYDDNGRGAAWVFTRSGNAWVQQGAKLSTIDAIGERLFQGRSVALSADGNTALIGGDGDSDATGAAWVFTRADGVWTGQAKLIGSGAAGKSGQGSAVGLSAIHVTDSVILSTSLLPLPDNETIHVTDIVILSTLALLPVTRTSIRRPPER